MKERKTLKFNSNGKFKVLQISDVQDTPATSVDTLRFLEAAIAAEKPDLIVLTGDQLDVMGIWGSSPAAKAKRVHKAILDVMSPIAKSGIPFLVTFGNHDCQTGIPNADQVDAYKEIDNCICFDNLDDGRPDCGTYNQLIMSSDGEKPAMNIYMVDSRSAAQGTVSGYDYVRENQLEWCKNKCEEAKAMNDGKTVPAILFQHIPVMEIYNVLKEVPKGTKGSIPAYRAFKGKSYIRDEEHIWQMGTYGETPAVPDVNGGEFEAIKKQGDVFAMFFGHDHYNSFIGKYEGIDLGYCPGAGFNTYGLNPRAMRVFEFDENDVSKYETHTVNYKKYSNKKMTQPVKNFVLLNAPSTLDAAVPFAIKVLIILAVIVAAFILLFKFIPIVGKILLIAIAALAVIYAIYSIVLNASLRKKLLKKFKS